ncbi:hypothetical protein BI335_08965 [Enemella evansiae]|uniref:hypothetical protein n=1 Tax=Enemella evansiae TaxID=2016499 RepID=UPI000B962680|nr:hypothetical protein [Enemella evansiae]OYO16885.1 hypothetical protein BI335_08965 [Enemella evansiae]
MNRTKRTLGLIAAAALTAGGLVACGNDVGDRQYCLDTQQEVRADDKLCESPGEPRYTWVWAERTSYVPAYYGRPGYRYYRYPVNDRGERTRATTRPARAATTKARSSSTTDDDTSTSSRTYGSSGTKGSKSNTKGSSGTKGTSSGSKGSSSGSKGSSSSGSKGSSSRR